MLTAVIRTESIQRVAGPLIGGMRVGSRSLAGRGSSRVADQTRKSVRVGHLQQAEGVELKTSPALGHFSIAGTCR